MKKINPSISFIEIKKQFLVLLLTFLSTSSYTQLVQQQGGKLVGTGNIGQGWQGSSVSLSADGNTAIVGGPWDNHYQGGSWIYARTSGVWTQIGTKLLGIASSDRVGPYRGQSVSLSADGNTAIIGGPGDYFGYGASWIFIRNNGVWVQQCKLFGKGGVGNPNEGHSVSLSADGNTAIVGGIFDNNYLGAAWVFTRSKGVWTQQGSKLVGTGNVGIAEQGTSVSLSADGNTAIVGGEYDNGYQGAVWVYTRNNGVWTQQGSKLVGTGTNGAAQGSSLSLSADGNTAIVGGFWSNYKQGAAWVYTRTNGVWTQQGGQLLGTGNVGAAEQGNSVALSADGNTAIVGGPLDNNYVGAAWIFTRSNGVWTQKGNKIVATGDAGAGLGYSISLSADGNTAIAGGPYENNWQGAAWVFTDVLLSAVSEGKVSIYPNPVMLKNFTVNFENKNKGSYDLSIYDISGVNMYHTTFKHSESTSKIQVALPALMVKGSYQIRIVGPDNFSKTKTFIIGELH